MLVHESMYTGAHADAAEAVRRLWRAGEFTSGRGLTRLQHLWEKDFGPVCAARAGGEPTPQSFDELREHVAEAVAQISVDIDPVIVVNSDKELNANQKRLDFQTDAVWRILVGGNQLSRGFTVEDLTISYYRRKTGQADTLMQAGRWFGFRPGYRDLVRLYIRRDEELDLYEAFESLLLDEESFREELQQYSGFDSDGKPVLEPRQIPPLVSQHLPWLRPTARSKMWNAVIDQKATGSSPRDFYGVPERGSTDLAFNAVAVGLPLARAADALVSLGWTRQEAGAAGAGQFDARIGVIDAETMIGLLASLRWNPRFEDNWAPTLKFLREATRSGRITEWSVVWPQLRTPSKMSEIDGIDVQVVDRSRRGDPRIDFVGSDRKHASALADVAVGSQGGLAPSSTRGAVLMYFADDRVEAKSSNSAPKANGDEVALLLTLYLPEEVTPTRHDLIRWTVRRGDSQDAVAVEP